MPTRHGTDIGLPDADPAPPPAPAAAPATGTATAADAAAQPAPFLPTAAAADPAAAASIAAAMAPLLAQMAQMQRDHHSDIGLGNPVTRTSAPPRNYTGQPAFTVTSTDID